MKKLFSRLACLAIILSIATFQSCQSDSSEDIPGNEPDTNGMELNSFEPAELDNMASILEAEGIIVETEDVDPQTKATVVGSNWTVAALKVTCKYPNPGGTGYIDMSGVLLVPKKTAFTKYVNHRLIIAPPSTYLKNDYTPTKLFKKIPALWNAFDHNFMFYWTLQARLGYVVLIPDYPGYGDSYKQCFVPYNDSKVMAGSMIALTKAAQTLLTSQDYKFKKEVIVTGYSQGGFIAAAIARELETTPGHGIPVNLLATGGAPFNYNQMIDVIRSSDKTIATYLFPYVVWGYKNNRYPNINVSDIMKEPYASQSSNYFDGIDGNVNSKFPTKVRDLYTDKFIDNLDTDPSLSYIRNILDENSIKPWKNTCGFVVTHGVNDATIYYKNAVNFVTDQRAAGGKVVFHPTTGSHAGAVVPYYATASTYIGFYR